jgi:hypothetical protein
MQHDSCCLHQLTHEAAHTRSQRHGSGFHELHEQVRLQQVQLLDQLLALLWGLCCEVMLSTPRTRLPRATVWQA